MKYWSSFILFIPIVAALLEKGTLTGYLEPETHVLSEPKKDIEGVFTRTRVARHLTGYCYEGWYEFGDQCYKPFGISSSERNTKSYAESACSRFDAHLVSIHSEEEQDFINLLLYDISYSTWIGLSRLSGQRETFAWSDSSSLDFTFWEDGEPNDHRGSQEDCVQMDHGRFDLGRWNDVPCSNRYAYICQKSKDPAITRQAPYPSLCTEPQGWMKLGTSCYKVFSKSESYASWSGAQSFCKSYGGDLVYVKSYVDTVFIRIQLTGLRGPFWTGIKSTIQHKYLWLGKHPLIYSNWQSDQPREIEDKEECVALDEEGKWMARDCDESHAFICEVNSELLGTRPTIAPYHANMTCPYTSLKWHDFGGKYCYIIELQERVTWDQASCRCSEEGGYLASFHSSQEVNVIVKYTKHGVKPLHIGFRRDSDGRFVWSDGSAADFMNWNNGEPNDRNEQCVEMKAASGRWNDIRCSSRYGYICSALKVPVRNESMSSTKKQKKGKTTAIGVGGTTLIILGVLTSLAIAGFALYHFRPSGKRNSVDKGHYSSIK